jgi:hypothetical protein
MKVKIKNPSDRKGKDWEKIFSKQLKSYQNHLRDRLFLSFQMANHPDRLINVTIIPLFLETFEPPSRSYNDLVIIHHMIVSLTISSYNSSFLGIILVFSRCIMLLLGYFPDGSCTWESHGIRAWLGFAGAPPRGAWERRFTNTTN